MRRDEQPAGLGKWKHRGIHHALTVDLSDVELDACLRCWPGDEEGTSGFFVAGFVRESHCHVDDDDEWEGFSD
jgi:putative methyltransferase